MKLFFKFMSLIFLPIMAVFFVMYFFVQSNIFTMVEQDLINEVKNKWEIIDQSIKSQTAEETSAFIRSISDKSPLRITIIAPDGIVIDDSYIEKDKLNELENHLLRPEVQKALHSTEGLDSRYSASTDREMLYYAKALDSKNILRLSYPLKYVSSIKTKMTTQNLAGFGSVLLILALVTAYIARKISLPMLQVKKIVEDIEVGNKPEFPDFNDPLMDKVGGLIYRTFNAVNAQKEEISHEKRKIARLLDILEEGIIQIDSKNRIIIANPKAEDFAGCKLIPDTNILKCLNDVEAIAFFKDIIEIQEDTTITKEMGQSTFEIYLRNIDSTRLMVIMDITDRVKYENYKSELISNISHELKTPLAMIMGYAETINNYPNMDRDKVNSFINKIYSGSTQLNTILNDVLELLKLETIEEGNFEKEDIELEEFVEELKVFYQESESQKISVNLIGESVNLYRGHLTSLITNLVDNAISYSKSEEIIIDIKSTAKGFFLSVSDEGPAIPQKERERIFERFYTISRSRNRSKSGTGLGLSIVKHICRIYKGNIALNDNEKGGNTFTVSLFPSKNN